jgi:hypothetical protein
MITLTSFSTPSAASIFGRTSTQLRPPLPLPSAGMAIDRIFFSRTTRFKSSSPVSIHSILELPRQCSLVGKLMIHFGLINCRLSVTNMRPTVTSFLLHAIAYALKFSGNASLNNKAMPFPIAPTVLTVFTNASALVSRRLPWVNSIIEGTNLFFGHFDRLRSTVRPRPRACCSPPQRARSQLTSGGDLVGRGQNMPGRGRNGTSLRFGLFDDRDGVRLSLPKHGSCPAAAVGGLSVLARGLLPRSPRLHASWRFAAKHQPRTAYRSTRIGRGRKPTRSWPVPARR